MRAFRTAASPIRRCRWAVSSFRRTRCVPPCFSLSVWALGLFLMRADRTTLWTMTRLSKRARSLKCCTFPRRLWARASAATATSPSSATSRVISAAENVFFFSFFFSSRSFSAPRFSSLHCRFSSLPRSLFSMRVKSRHGRLADSLSHCVYGPHSTMSYMAHIVQRT